jgi:hypothetical protein
MQLTGLVTWIGHARRERARARAIADAYLAWLEAMHPWLFDAHAAALAALREAATPAELAPRIAHLDRILARVA